MTGSQVLFACAILLCCATTTAAQAVADADTQARPAVVTGLVTDESGTAIAGATLAWSPEGQTAVTQAITGPDGRGK